MSGTELRPTDYVVLPTLLWTPDGGLTEDGHRFMAGRYPGEVIKESTR